MCAHHCVDLIDECAVLLDALPLLLPVTLPLHTRNPVLLLINFDNTGHFITRALTLAMSEITGALQSLRVVALVVVDVACVLERIVDPFNLHLNRISTQP